MLPECYQWQSTTHATAFPACATMPQHHTYHHTTIPPYHHTTIPPYHHTTIPPYHHPYHRTCHHTDVPLYVPPLYHRTTIHIHHTYHHPYHCMCHRCTTVPPYIYTTHTTICANAVPPYHTYHTYHNTIIRTAVCANAVLLNIPPYVLPYMSTTLCTVFANGKLIN